MPMYEFQTPDGDVVEKFIPMKDAPDFGEVVDVDGVPCKRIASPSAVSRPTWTPYVSSRLPKNLPGFECTKSGKPIISSQAVERNAASKLGWSRD